MSRADEPAFPALGTMGEVAPWGLTIREEFAKAAMQGLCANRGMVTNIDSESAMWIAAKSVFVADALLAELAKPVKP